MSDRIDRFFERLEARASASEHTPIARQHPVLTSIPVAFAAISLALGALTGLAAAITLVLALVAGRGTGWNIIGAPAALICGTWLAAGAIRGFNEIERLQRTYLRRFTAES